jgi:hypothetical protein
MLVPRFGLDLALYHTVYCKTLQEFYVIKAKANEIYGIYSILTAALAAWQTHSKKLIYQPVKLLDIQWTCVQGHAVTTSISNALPYNSLGD